MSPDDFSALSHFCLVVESPRQFSDTERSLALFVADFIEEHGPELCSMPPEVLKGAILALLGAHKNEAGPEVSMVHASARARRLERAR